MLRSYNSLTLCVCLKCWLEIGKLSSLSFPTRYPLQTKFQAIRVAKHWGHSVAAGCQLLNRLCSAPNPSLTRLNVIKDFISNCGQQDGRWASHSSNSTGGSSGGFSNTDNSASTSTSTSSNHFSPYPLSPLASPFLIPAGQQQQQLLKDHKQEQELQEQQHKQKQQAQEQQEHQEQQQQKEQHQKQIRQQQQQQQVLATIASNNTSEWDRCGQKKCFGKTVPLLISLLVFTCNKSIRDICVHDSAQAPT
jgi:hypothetical protein